MWRYSNGETSQQPTVGSAGDESGAISGDIGEGTNRRGKERERREDLLHSQKVFIIFF